MLQSQGTLYERGNCRSEIWRNNMKRIKTINTRNLSEDLKKAGCGECQTSCQSASKTSCSVANQRCEQKK